MVATEAAVVPRSIVWEPGTDIYEHAFAKQAGNGVLMREPTSESPRRRPIRVLVVDDERQIVDFLCLLLEDEGFRVLRAYDGVQAWDLIRADPPDLVITDVMMPRMSGLQLVQRLKETLNGTCPPVIVMSAVTRVTDPKSVRFLPKPFDIERMLDLVEELIAR